MGYGSMPNDFSLFSLPTRYANNPHYSATETALQKQPSRVFARVSGANKRPKEYDEWVRPYRADFDAQQQSLHGGVLDTSFGAGAKYIANTLEERIGFG